MSTTVISKLLLCLKSCYINTWSKAGGKLHTKYDLNRTEDKRVNLCHTVVAMVT